MGSPTGPPVEMPDASRRWATMTDHTLSSMGMLRGACCRPSPVLPGAPARRYGTPSSLWECTRPSVTSCGVFCRTYLLCRDILSNVRFLLYRIGLLICLDQLVLNSIARSCIAGHNAQFAVNGTEVGMHRAWANNQPFSYFSIPQSLRYQAQHLDLTCAQSIGVGDACHHWRGDGCPAGTGRAGERG